jgi:hypothetical protein
MTLNMVAKITMMVIGVNPRKVGTICGNANYSIC